MARIIYTGIVESIRGSIAGTTFQQNKYGYTVKSKPNMIKPNTPFQQYQKSLFARASTAWGALTQGWRDSWNTWANTYPQYAKHNPTAQLSGYAVFVRSQLYLYMEGGGNLQDPEFVDYPAVTITLALQYVADVLTLITTDDNGSENYDVLLFASRPFKSTQNFIGTAPRYFTSFTTTGGESVNVEQEWIEHFGVLPLVGDYIALRGIPFVNTNGKVQAAQSFIVQVTD